MIFFLASAVVFPEPTLLEDSAGRLPSRGVSTRGPIIQKKKEKKKKLSEFHEKFQEIKKVLNILRNSARKIRKIMLEISGICEKFLFFEWNFQWTP